MRELNRYIDRCLIDEYADKDYENGWSLDVDSLPPNELATFLDKLMQHDTSIRDLVHYHMQLMIDERLEECEVECRHEDGFTVVQHANGDRTLEGIRGY